MSNRFHFSLWILYSVLLQKWQRVQSWGRGESCKTLICCCFAAKKSARPLISSCVPSVTSTALIWDSLTAASTPRYCHSPPIQHNVHRSLRIDSTHKQYTFYPNSGFQGKNRRFLGRKSPDMSQKQAFASKSWNCHRIIRCQRQSFHIANKTHSTALSG